MSWRIAFRCCFWEELERLFVLFLEYTDFHSLYVVICTLSVSAHVVLYMHLYFFAQNLLLAADSRNFAVLKVNSGLTTYNVEPNATYGTC